MCETSENLISKMDELEDPVFYCQHCLNLKIMQAEKTNQCYCGVCGNLDILLTDISDWETKYINRYGKKYLEQGEIQVLGKQKESDGENTSV